MKAKLYPVSIKQPNQNQSSGLAGKCFKEVRRNKKTYNASCRDQKDPKYHHLWNNVSNLKKGKTARCGRKSSYHCSHETYYGIKGYRNTCPIAGVTGTYTQPAKLQLFFNPDKKGIISNSKIKSVKFYLSHRCTGVDVENDSETDGWGPNFSGFDTYPNRKVLTVKFAGQTKTYNINPPLSKKNFNTIDPIKFTNISYNDLKNGHLDIIYGNNLSTNPGNLFIKGVYLEVEYDPSSPYVDGVAKSKSLYTSKEEQCCTKITFKLEAGYKNGNKKIAPANAPKKLQNTKVEAILPPGVTVSYDRETDDGKTILATIIDKSYIKGKKSVIFNFPTLKKKLTFKYEAQLRKKPDIQIPEVIEKNTSPNGITGIILKNGCTKTLKAFDGGVNGLSYSFNSDKITVQDDGSISIDSTEANSFYNWMATKLTCGTHKIYFQRGGEAYDDMIFKYVKIIPTQYTFKFTQRIDNKDVEIISPFELIQNKSQNTKIKIHFVDRSDLITKPKFSITNSTYGLEVNNKPTKDRISTEEIPWQTSNGNVKEITVGTYYPGNYKIQINEPENCGEKKTNLDIHISPKHKQYFDEVFVRGEDSTAFDYDYLVALEGDTIQKPLFVKKISLGNSFEDIRICTKDKEVSGLTEDKTITLKVSNNSQNDIINLFLELNALIEDEDGNLSVSTAEWLDEDGMFNNFIKKFNIYNENLNQIVTVKNLSPDDDYVEEEDVYIHIKKILAGEELNIEIPFSSYEEKDVYLQILLGGEPVKLYNIQNCFKKEDCFTEIHLKTYDSILTNMDIIGEIDLHKPSSNCPLKCFETELEYKIRNIDTSSLNYNVETLINNDPRLVPKEIKYEGVTYDNLSSLPNNIHCINEPIIQGFNVTGTKVVNKISFPNYPTQTLSGYTDSNGYIIFFIEIPKSIGKSYTVNSLKSICSLKVKDSNMDNIIEVIDDYRVYTPGQSIPFRVHVTSTKTVLTNQITFLPKIFSSGDCDSLKVLYKVCNLPKNRGILKTTFESNDYKLIPNRIEKDILCGVKTNLILDAWLSKVVVEQEHYNRLYLQIDNKERFNKDIKITIEENKTVDKYKYTSSSLDSGNIILIDNNSLISKKTNNETESIDSGVESETSTVKKIWDLGKLNFLDFDSEIYLHKNKIVWNIGDLDANTTIYGYIDLKGSYVGLSDLKITAEDFLSKTEFDEKECDCSGE